MNSSKNYFLLFSSILLMGMALADDFYSDKIQPIFNNRCIACHSCYNAPCQLNLQDHTGFVRGATKELVYNGYRLESAKPTRLWIDALTEASWREKNFFPVNNSKQTGESIFYQIVTMKNDSVPQSTVGNSDMCVSDKSELKEFLKTSPEKGMPYGLPKLKKSQLNDIKTWIEQGAPGPGPEALEAEIGEHLHHQNDIKAWEYFLNRKDNEHRLVARYIYEHMFLAHVSFTEERTRFFRLIRSGLPCEKNGEEIRTRTPNENPGTKNVFYCFRPNPGAIIAKTHVPIVLNGKKMRRYEEIFFKNKWKTTKLPDYDRMVAANPFIAFKDIPTRARYEYLLEDARYHVNTFIKGPVCNGSAAVNSIQEHFFVSFIDPDADVMVISDAFEQKSRDHLLLPGTYGSDVSLKNTPLLIKDLTKRREAFRLLKKDWVLKARPLGFSYSDIWKRKEGYLTVFRHDDNASVLYGHLGGMPKTLFFLDYSLFERLVYNLVVNFDVYGNIGHQTLTRIYMDLIRMEAEENFLAFLPQGQRKKIRDSWYRGYLTKLKMDYIFPDVLDDLPVNIKYTTSDVKKEFMTKLGTFNKEGTPFPSILAKPGKNNYANYFPELTLVRLVGKENSVFSIVRNREHENVSWILAEEYRLSPEEDSLSLVNGFAGTYPNLFLEVKESKLKEFINQIKKLKSRKAFNALVRKHSVNRNDERFWHVYDSMNEVYLQIDPLEAGYLDLTRYDL